MFFNVHEQQIITVVVDEIEDGHIKVLIAIAGFPVGGAIMPKEKFITIMESLYNYSQTLRKKTPVPNTFLDAFKDDGSSKESS